MNGLFQNFLKIWAEIQSLDIRIIFYRLKNVSNMLGKSSIHLSSLFLILEVTMSLPVGDSDPMKVLG